MDPENGSIRLLPFRGAPMDQPFFTMMVLRTVKAAYIKRLESLKSKGGK